MKKVRATYSLEADSYILDFDYTYYYSLESPLNPAESELEINQVYLNKEDITDFYFDIVSDSSLSNTEGNILEDAHQHI